MAFILFGSETKSAKLYFIEGDDETSCAKILKESFGLESKVECGISDLHLKENINDLFNLFYITEDIFTQPQPQRDCYHYIKSKEKITLNPKIDGEFCKLCKNFAGMAASNQSDGSFICWSCRDSKTWMFQ